MQRIISALAIAALIVSFATVMRASPATQPAPATRSTSRTAAPPKLSLKSFTDGRDTHRATITAIDKTSVTVTYRDNADSGPQTYKLTPKTRVLFGQPAPVGPQQVERQGRVTIIRGAQGMRFRNGKISELRPGWPVEIAADEDQNVVLIASVFSGDLVIVGLPPPPASWRVPTTAATRAATTQPSLPRP